MSRQAPSTVTPHQSSTGIEQTTLSQKLLLLETLHYSEVSSGNASRSNRPERVTDQLNDALHALDFIALAFATGSGGDVYAAALDPGSGGTPRLLLAKNLPVDRKRPGGDPEYAKMFLTTLCDIAKAERRKDNHAESQQRERLLGLIVKRCAENIKKRKNKLLQCIQQFSDDETIKAMLRNYSATADPTKEFRGQMEISVVAQWMSPPGGETTTVENIVQELLLEFRTQLQRPITTQTTGALPLLARYAQAVRGCEFIRTLAQSDKVHVDTREKADKLMRNCSKVSQYVLRTGQASRFVLRYFPHGITEDSFRWIGEAGTEAQIHLGDLVGSLSQHGGYDPNNQTIVNKFSRLLVKMNEQWERANVVKPHVHAELRIITRAEGYPTKPDVAQPIGVSKRSCLSCYLWMKEYNEKFGTQWMTTGTHGKPYAAWSFPIIPETHLRARTRQLLAHGNTTNSSANAGNPSAIATAVRSKIDEVLMKECLKIIESGSKTPKGNLKPRISDEHASAGSASEEELEVEVYNKYLGTN